jgi:small subunit ribosomal protein S4
MREKQKAKIIYGVLEKQFRKYYEQMKQRGGKESLLGILERRFDNIIFRIGLAVSRREARQMVLHGNFKINGKKTNIPSYQLKIGDKIELNNKEKSKELIKNLKSNQKRMTPISWIKLNPDEITAEITSMPKKEDIGDEINERLIVEYYSR